MKSIIIILAFLSLTLSGLNAQEKEILTNESIITLVELGMTDEVIIAKIVTSDTNFNSDINSLKNLKEKNVSPEVIKTMITHDHKTRLLEAEKTGIYIVEDGKEEQIFPTLFSASNTRFLAAQLTYGIASIKNKSSLSGSKSSFTVKQDSIEFAFYFREFKENQINATDWWFRATTSPQEFILVKLNVNERKNIRELEIGKANAWVGTDSGVNSKKIIKCKVVKIRDGKFSVVPIGRVPIGEYCFFYAGRIPEGGYTNQSVFDFSVQ